MVLTVASTDKTGRKGRILIDFASAKEAAVYDGESVFQVSREDTCYIDR